MKNEGGESLWCYIHEKPAIGTADQYGASKYPCPVCSRRCIKLYAGELLYAFGVLTK